MTQLQDKEDLCVVVDIQIKNSNFYATELCPTFQQGNSSIVYIEMSKFH